MSSAKAEVIMKTLHVTQSLERLPPSDMHSVLWTASRPSSGIASWKTCYSERVWQPSSALRDDCIKCFFFLTEKEKSGSSMQFAIMALFCLLSTTSMTRTWGSWRSKRTWRRLKGREDGIRRGLVLQGTAAGQLPPVWRMSHAAWRRSGALPCVGNVRPGSR